MKRRNFLTTVATAVAAGMGLLLSRREVRAEHLFNPECKAEDVDLCSCMDAQVWAREFARRYPCMLCEIPGHEGATNEVEEIMVGWFANAIMAGYDNASRRPVPNG